MGEYSQIDSKSIHQILYQFYEAKIQKDIYNLLVKQKFL